MNERTKHSHYFRDVSHLNEVDVYRVLQLFNVTDQAIGHAVKKLLCMGLRGVKKDTQDVSEAIDTLQRWMEMRAEDESENRLQSQVRPAETCAMLNRGGDCGCSAGRCEMTTGGRFDCPRPAPGETTVQFGKGSPRA